MKPTLFAGLIATACFAMPATAQDQPAKEKRETKTVVINMDMDSARTELNGATKNKIKIVRNVNGKEEVIEREFTGTDLPADLKQQIKDMNLKIEEPTRLDMSDKKINGKIEIKRDVNGKEVVIVEQFKNASPADIKGKINQMEIKISGDSAQSFHWTSDKANEAGKQTKVVVVSGCKMAGKEDFTFNFGEAGKMPEDVKKMLEEKGIKSEGKNVFYFSTDSKNEDITNTYKLENGKEVSVCISKICIIKIADNTQPAQEEGKAEAPTEPQVADLNVYPNPNDGEFNLKFNLPQKGDAHISLHDKQGNLVYEEDLKDFSGEYKKPLSLKNQKAGQYVLRIVQNGKIYTRQVLVK
ncbi:MAG: T9SS C-terminal target domain-containing protein [Bacteroidetes bacterium]|nr:MAG: T9SS C-terminal target domain-containing protein [Bacteroidota bacterium]